MISMNEKKSLMRVDFLAAFFTSEMECENLVEIFRTINRNDSDVWKKIVLASFARQA